MAEHPVGTPAATDPRGWYPDPVHGAALRFWDGAAWTRWVSNGELVLADKLPTAAAPGPAASAMKTTAPASPVRQAPGRPPSSHPWRPVLFLVAGGLLAVALGVLLVLTSPPAPISDIPAQAFYGALSVFIGSWLIFVAAVAGLMQLTARARRARRAR